LIGIGFSRAQFWVLMFFTMITNTTLAVWSPELFPTAIRASGTSIVNGIGNIAGAVMPFLAALFARFGLAGVFGMVAVMYALLVVASRLAPETQDQTLEEANEGALALDPAPAAV
jgi:putative MFS transporter